jgi:hypothetical protein
MFFNVEITLPINKPEEMDVKKITKKGFACKNKMKSTWKRKYMRRKEKGGALRVGLWDQDGNIYVGQGMKTDR